MFSIFLNYANSNKYPFILREIIIIFVSVCKNCIQFNKTEDYVSLKMRATHNFRKVFLCVKEYYTKEREREYCEYECIQSVCHLQCQ